MVDVVTPSGLKVAANPAPFIAAQRLWHAVERVMAERSIQLGGSIQNTLMMVDSEPSVNEALWPCLARSTVDGKKITPDLFEPIEMRREYYAIISPCVEENIRPFADSLSSELIAKLEILKKKQPNDTPKSE